MEVETGYWRQDEEAQRKAVDGAGYLMMPATAEDIEKKIKALQEEQEKLAAKLAQMK